MHNIFMVILTWMPMLLCAQKHYPVVYQDSLYIVDSTLGKDIEVSDMLKQYRRQEQDKMNVVIGYSTGPLSKAQPECTLGILLVDAQLESARQQDPDTKIAVSNQGGIRVNYISPGAITLEQIYKIMPFDNKLVIVELPGSKVEQLCQLIAAYGGWPVSGITFQIKDKKAINILIDGKPVNPQLIYKAAMSDYIVNGGDNVDFLEGCRKQIYNIFIRDCLKNYIESRQAKGEKINIELQNRISYVDE